MQPEQAPDTPAQASDVQQQANPAPTSISDPTDRQSQIIFADLIQEFEKIETVADPIEKQYVLESFLKKSDLSREAYIKLFELYQKEKKTNQWLSKRHLAPLARLEKLVEKTALTLNEMDIFKIIQQIGNIAIVFTVASLIWNVLPNRDKEIEEAWKVVESKDVGRRTRYAAIEKLNRYNQPLDYLNLPTGAYLPKIKLAGANLSNSVLPKAILSGANLQGAWLGDANLQEANLIVANLQKAQLVVANLQGARLGGANLQGAVLVGANLQGARLGGANLQGARLRAANLQGAELSYANLQGAVLVEAKLQKAVLWAANLQGAELVVVNLQGAELVEAKLQKAELSYANLQKAVLWAANLQGAYLGGANLQGAELGEANLQGADLGKAKLQGAYLGGANLQGADLGKAKLQGAKYTDKNTKPELCEKSFFNYNYPCPTIFPKNFDPKAAGMVLLK